MRRHVLILVAGLATLTAGGLAGAASAGMTDADWTHCRAVGVADKQSVDSDIAFMQRPDQQGQFSADDIKKMQDLSKGIETDYLSYFDQTQPVDQADVDRWAAKDHDALDAELNHCFDMMEADLDEVLKSANEVLNSYSASQSSSSSSQ